MIYTIFFIQFYANTWFLFLCSENERSQIAYVTFKDAQGAETAVLLSVSSLRRQSLEFIVIIKVLYPIGN